MQTESVFEDLVRDPVADRIAFGPRLAAYLIDYAMMQTGSWFIAGVLGAVGLMSDEAPKPNTSDGLVKMLVEMLDAMSMSFVVGGLVALVFYLPELLTGQSLAKMIMKFRVGAPDGHTASQKALLTRYLFKVASSVLVIAAGLARGDLLLPLLGVAGLYSIVYFFGCFMALSERRQALHDLLANTAVYRKDDVHAL